MATTIRMRVKKTQDDGEAWKNIAERVIMHQQILFFTCTCNRRIKQMKEVKTDGLLDGLRCCLSVLSEG
jgi:hypothetical protein